ncbi:MAG: glycosyltransferase family 4 protein [Bacteroidales bacterium]|nr:glycosyltransferase family 4 protein [Bacteroidales bacterium]
MKLVYVLGGNYDANGMCSIITKKINWYAENTDWEIVALLTESARGREFYFPLHPSVKIVNFELDFDELDVMPKLKKLIRYSKKQKLYKKMFSDFLFSYRPDVVVSAMRREINFLSDIKDGSLKVGELHFCRNTYRVFSHLHLPGFLCRAITRYWQGRLLKQIRRLDAFVVLTDEDRKAWGNVPNIHVIPNFITDIPSVHSSCQNKTVVAVGRYTWQKGFDMLLRAWRKVEDVRQDWQLKIVGAGDSSEYSRLAQELQLKCVEFSRPVKDVNEVFGQSSIMAFSSRYEGFGMVLIEAMACGVPTVSFACPCGPSDIISDGIDGYLVPDFDVDLFAGRLLSLMSADKERIEMGLRARDNMMRFRQVDVMRRWMALFTSFQAK